MERTLPVLGTLFVISLSYGHPLSPETTATWSAIVVDQDSAQLTVTLEIPVQNMPASLAHSDALATRRERYWTQMADALTLSVDGTLRTSRWLPTWDQTNGRRAGNAFVFYLEQEVPLTPGQPHSIVLTNAIAQTKSPYRTAWLHAPTWKTTHSALQVLPFLTKQPENHAEVWSQDPQLITTQVALEPLPSIPEASPRLPRVAPPQ